MMLNRLGDRETWRRGDWEKGRLRDLETKRREIGRLGEKHNYDKAIKRINIDPAEWRGFLFQKPILFKIKVFDVSTSYNFTADLLIQ